MSNDDTVYALEQALAAAREHRISTGSRDYSMVEALEAQIEAARQPKPLGPVFGSAKFNPPTPAAPVQPAAAPLPIRVSPRDNLT